MWMKSHVEGIRALAYFGAYCMDMSKISKTEVEKGNWEGYLELLTPIIKSYSTDKGLLICSLAMDVYGGYGYCSEYPVEQFMRDEKSPAFTKAPTASRRSISSDASWVNAKAPT